MPLLQLIGMLALMGTVGGTLLAGICWLRTRRPFWGRIALGLPGFYLICLVGVTAARGQETLPPGTPLHFCGFYLDCHLSVAVTHVEQGPSDWSVTLHLANDARRMALAPIGLRVELMQGDSTVQLVPDANDLATPIQAGASRDFTVAFAAPRAGETPALRVSDGYGIDRVIEGSLLGDDDALGRVRVKLGL
jgi:hypothetical protein